MVPWGTQSHFDSSRQHEVGLDVIAVKKKNSAIESKHKNLFLHRLWRYDKPPWSPHTAFSIRCFQSWACQSSIQPARASSPPLEAQMHFWETAQWSANQTSLWICMQWYHDEIRPIMSIAKKSIRGRNPDRQRVDSIRFLVKDLLCERKLLIETRGFVSESCDALLLIAKALCMWLHVGITLSTHTTKEDRRRNKKNTK